MATIKRNASAKWSGTGKEGKGAITTQSGVLKHFVAVLLQRRDATGENVEVHVLGVARAAEEEPQVHAALEHEQIRVCDL